MNNDLPLPPGKAALIRWMKSISGALRYPEDLHSVLDLIKADEYVIALEGLIRPGMFGDDLNWSDAEIERYAKQLNDAILETAKDLHSEYIPDEKMDELFEDFYAAAGYKGD